MVALTGVVRQPGVAHSRLELPTRIGPHLPASNPPFPSEETPSPPARPRLGEGALPHLPMLASQRGHKKAGAMQSCLAWPVLDGSRLMPRAGRWHNHPDGRRLPAPPVARGDCRAGGIGHVSSNPAWT